MVDYFNEFWAVYPIRAGNRDKSAAVKAFNAALKRGADPNQIIDGARAYAAFSSVTGKLKTEYIRQARTWLNANGWTETYEHAATNSGKTKRQHPIDIAADKFMAELGLEPTEFNS